MTNISHKLRVIVNEGPNRIFMTSCEILYNVKNLKNNILFAVHEFLYHQESHY